MDSSSSVNSHWAVVVIEDEDESAASLSDVAIRSFGLTRGFLRRYNFSCGVLICCVSSIAAAAPDARALDARNAEMIAVDRDNTFMVWILCTHPTASLPMIKALCHRWQHGAKNKISISQLRDIKGFFDAIWMALL